jgi:hypothetical protein
MVKNTSDKAHVCRQLLATFFAGIKSACARWFPIVFIEPISNANEHGLSLLMALDYNDAYLPLMMACALIIKQSINIKGIEAVIVDTPCIMKGWLNKLGYTWDDFIAEFGLSIMEVAHLYIEKRKTYFVRVGEFKEDQFTIQDQLTGRVLEAGKRPQLYYGGC